MSRSENGWPVIPENTSPPLVTVKVPTKHGTTKLRVRGGDVALVLAHFALLWDDHIEPVYGQVLDDWGYAYRPVRGQASGFSNHASGTAIDLNATKHPLGTLTFSSVKRALLLALMKPRYAGVLRWGGTYSGRKDQMHVEIAPGATAAQVAKVARRLRTAPGGRRLRNANPGMWPA